jgi:hypothetical protein
MPFDRHTIPGIFQQIADEHFYALSVLSSRRILLPAEEDAG